MRWTQEQIFAHIFHGRSNYYYDLEKTKMNHQIKLKTASVEAVKTVIQQSRSYSKKERLEDLYRRTIGREIASLRDAYR